MYFFKVTPKTKEKIKFSISNVGKTGFFYTVQFNAKSIENSFSFTVSQKKGFIASNKIYELIIYLEAFKKAILRNFKVKINVLKKYLVNCYCN